MTRKFICLCVAFCMVFTFMISAQAKGNRISSKTVITEDNISAVLNYLGIDSSSFIKSDLTGNSVCTVGDLEKAIGQIKKLPSEIKDTGKTDSNATSANSLITTAATSGSGTVMLYSTVDVGGTYEVEYEVAGQYSNGLWTGASSATVSVDSNFLLYTYKISSKSLNLTYTSTKITLNAKVVVDVYVGVGDFGLVKIGSQTITSTVYWDTSDIP